MVDKVFDDLRRTPLHFLAQKGKLRLITHPSIACIPDNRGFTPLHYLALNVSKCNAEKLKKFLNHPDIDKVKNVQGDTPLHLLTEFRRNIVKSSHLKEKYPWYPNEIKEPIWSGTITQILDYPNSYRFILED